MICISLFSAFRLSKPAEETAKIHSQSQESCSSITSGWEAFQGATNNVLDFTLDTSKAIAELLHYYLEHVVELLACVDYTVLPILYYTVCAIVL